jgi:hypothetical protein
MGCGTQASGWLGRVVTVIGSLVAPICPLSAAHAAVIGPSVQVKDGGSFYPSVCYNPTSDQYLVLWGQYTSSPVKLRGQRVSANSEDLLGPEFAVGSWPAEYCTYIQCMTYNPENGEWFVVYVAELPDHEDNRCAQRINASTGALAGHQLPWFAGPRGSVGWRNDGTTTGGIENAGVRVIGDPGGYAQESFIAVKGVVSCFESSGMRPQAVPSDVQALRGP